ncbi:type II toxin-antitoxin system YhaV family toxin (plasmid) [Pantoea dispersa]|uniref:type II toxin-antitoxin system YhaV family toxin n=1 Tax=Pantoea dispersa TaxID=59814 RepID=UPI001CA6C6B1|nr:type II toxin-antitoxin system YhaV family toxin [Pantoea dispersa]
MSISTIYDSKTDAYKVFIGMLNAGHPPDNWDKLLRQAKSATAGSSISGFLAE